MIALSNSNICLCHLPPGLSLSPSEQNITTHALQTQARTSSREALCPILSLPHPNAPHPTNAKGVTSTVTLCYIRLFISRPNLLHYTNMTNLFIFSEHPPAVRGDGPQTTSTFHVSGGMSSGLSPSFLDLKPFRRQLFCAAVSDQAALPAH